MDMLDIASPAARINDIREGRVRFDGDMARHILDVMNVSFQRRIEQPHVDALASQMRANIWVAGKQIAFGRLGGKLYLVDGQHRLSAVSQTDLPQEFQVLVVSVDSERGLRELYRRFDAMMRTRSTSQLLNAAGVHEEQGVTKMMAKSVYSAMGFILNDMKTPIGSHAQNSVQRRVIDFRLEECRPFWHSARAYQKAVDKAGKGIRSKLYLGAVVAVALQTYRHQPARAENFWSRIAANDGLRKGDPCHTLVQHLLVASDRGSGDSYMGACAAAWNSFYANRSLSILRPSMPIVLKGVLVGRGE